MELMPASNSILKDDKKLDLVSTGSPPNDFKYSDHGCEFATATLSPDQNELVVMARCPKQIEVFLFHWEDDGTGEVVRVDVVHRDYRNTEEHFTPIADQGTLK